MTISLRGASAVSQFTTTAPVSVAFHGGSILATDISFLQVVAKPSSGILPQDVSCSTPSGWTLLFANSSGQSAPSTPEGSSGSVKVFLFYRTGSTSTTAPQIMVANHSTAAASINTYAGNGTGWSTSTTYGYDNDSSGSTYSSNNSLPSTDLLLATNDWMLVITALTNSNGVGTLALISGSATLASSTGTLRQSQNVSTTTPDTSNLWMDVRDVAITGVTGSTCCPRMTTTTVQDGITLFVRLREGVNTLSGSDTVSGGEMASLGAQLTMPVPRNWVSGDDFNAANLNAGFRDPINWLLTDSPGIQVECTVPVTFNSSSHTITWDTIRYRRGSMVVSGTKVSVPTTGHYVGQVSAGIKDLGTMGIPFVITFDILTYPGGIGTANVHNVSVNFTTLDAESNQTEGSIPFTLYLNQGDAIEVKMSGGWNTAGGVGLWVGPDAAAVNQAAATMLDLHWFGTWDGVSR